MLKATRVRARRERDHSCGWASPLQIAIQLSCWIFKGAFLGCPKVNGSRLSLAPSNFVTPSLQKTQMAGIRQVVQATKANPSKPPTNCPREKRRFSCPVLCQDTVDVLRFASPLTNRLASKRTGGWGDMGGSSSLELVHVLVGCKGKPKGKPSFW